MFKSLPQTIHLLSYAIGVFFGLYALFELYLLNLAITLPLKKKAHSASRQGVSLIIPIKNEAPRLQRLLESLDHLNYASDLEIIFIDDDSNDRSAEIITRYSLAATRPIRIINGRYDPSCRLTSKQQALDLGIDQATHGLIALTDADMELNPDWLDKLCCALHEDTALVFGHTVIPCDGTMFTTLQSFQLEFLFSIAALFHYAGITGSCMGNNLLLRKKAYLACGGQKAIGYSITEDRALLRLFHRNRYPTAIVTPFFPSATTLPHKTVRGFIHQISRWAAGGFTSGLNLLFFGTVFIVYNITFLLAMAGVVSGWCRVAGIGSFLVSWLVTAVTFKKNRSPVSPLLFPVFFIMTIVETIAVPGFFLFGKKIYWKGRRI